LVRWWPLTPECKKGVKGDVAGVICDPVNVWSLNGNSSKMAKDANFKFGTHAPRKIPDMTPEKIVKRGRVRIM